MNEEIMARLIDSQKRGRILDQFNRSILDDLGPLGEEQGMKVLSEVNSLADDHDEFVRSLATAVSAFGSRLLGPTSGLT